MIKAGSGVKDAGAQLPFSLSFSPGLQPWDGAPHTQGESSLSPPWITLTARCVSQVITNPGK